MGTTESIFYDDGDVLPPPQETVTSTPATNPSATPHVNGPTSLASRPHPHQQRQQGGYDNSLGDDRRIPRRSVIPLSSAAAAASRTSTSPDPAAGTAQRPRTRPVPVPVPPGRHTKPLRRLEGWLGGASETGKQSLLLRLQGRDPFSSPSSSSSHPERSDGNHHQRSDETGTTSSITVPYRPPQGCHCWERIQLHIQNMSLNTNIEGGTHAVEDEHRNVPSTTSPPSPLPDFAVILINPLDDDLGSVHNNIYQSVIQYVTKLGYGGLKNKTKNRKDGNEDNGNAEDRNQRTTNKQGSNRPPVCLCLVWNFRDLLDEKDTQQFAMYTERQALLLQFVNNALKSLGVMPSQTTIVCIETSMKNCYGLDRLHQFIYRSYLELKKYELQSILQNVEDQIGTIDRSNESIRNTPNAYRDFLAVLSSVASATLTVKPSRQSSHEKDMNHDIPPLTNSQTQQNGEAKGKDSNATSSLSSQRKILLTKEKKLNPTLRVGKEALEAFLASSSDEEDESPSSRKGRVKSQKVPNSKSGPYQGYDDDDDDDDDDFFYDESGQQHVHHNSKRSSHRSDDDDSRSSSSSSSHVNSNHSGIVDTSNKVQHDGNATDREPSEGDKYAKAENDSPASLRTSEKVEHDREYSNENDGTTQSQTSKCDDIDEGNASEKSESASEEITADVDADDKNDKKSVESSTEIKPPTTKAIASKGSDRESSDYKDSENDDAQSAVCDGIASKLEDETRDGDAVVEVENHDNNPSDDNHDNNPSDDEEDDDAFIASTPEEETDKGTPEYQQSVGESIDNREAEETNETDDQDLDEDPGASLAPPERPTAVESVGKDEGDGDDDYDDDDFMIGSTAEEDVTASAEKQSSHGGIVLQSDEDQSRADDEPASPAPASAAEVASHHQPPSAPAEQPTGISAAALAAIQAAHAEAEAMLSMSATFDAEKATKKKKKKKDKDEKKKKKEKKRKKSKDQDVDAVDSE